VQEEGEGGDDNIGYVAQSEKGKEARKRRRKDNIQKREDKIAPPPPGKKEEVQQAERLP
jgi:hypothetical protein